MANVVFISATFRAHSTLRRSALRVTLPSLETRLSVRVAVRRAGGDGLREMLRRSGEMAYDKVYSRPEVAWGRHFLFPR